MSEGPPLPSLKILPENGTLDPITEKTGGEILRYKVSETPDWFEVIGRLRRRYLAGFHAPPPFKAARCATPV